MIPIILFLCVVIIVTVVWPSLFSQNYNDYYNFTVIVIVVTIGVNGPLFGSITWMLDSKNLKNDLKDYSTEHILTDFISQSLKHVTSPVELNLK